MASPCPRTDVQTRPPPRIGSPVAPGSPSVLRRVLAASLVLALAAPAYAEGPVLVDPAEIATHASAVLEAHCADVSAKRGTASADAMAVVSAELAAVSRSYDLTSSMFLRYWRGRLYDCLSYDQPAVDDFDAFTRFGAEMPAIRALVRDARRRMGRLRVGERKAPPGSAVLGVVLLAGSGAPFGLAAWQSSEMLASQEQYQAGLRPYSETEGIGEQRTREAQAATALWITGAVVATAGIVSVVLAGVTQKSPPKVVATVAPLPSGVGFGIGGSW